MTKITIDKNQAKELLRRLPEIIKLLDSGFAPCMVLYDNKSEPRCKTFVTVDFRNKRSIFGITGSV
jgi:hypothetical protein